MSPGGSAVRNRSRTFVKAEIIPASALAKVRAPTECARQRGVAMPRRPTLLECGEEVAEKNKFNRPDPPPASFDLGLRAIQNRAQGATWRPCGPRPS